jgi:hypothetical protein
MTTPIERLDTWYIPENEAHHVEFPALRDGNEEAQVLLIDDRGDLLAPVYVEEAEHDGLLLLKQFGAASALIETVSAAKEYGDVDPTDRTWRIRRLSNGQYEVDDVSADSAADAM